jgi:hypothetical protein
VGLTRFLLLDDMDATQDQHRFGVDWILGETFIKLGT